ncbi:MAG TPA: four helix bundle protein [Gemmatimonadales bacterium]|nr:four helix bundle protein [Gemmatimonadales bacterium]
MQSFKDLEVWQLAHRLRVQVYDLVAHFPRDERYGLRAQVTGAAGSVAANIAEGCGRNGDPEFARFLDMAMGSATELECHLLCARDRRFADETALRAYLADLDRLQRMIAALTRTVRGPRRSRRSLRQQPIANSHQPAANSQQPAANSQQPSASSQKPVANSQHPNGHPDPLRIHPPRHAG